jgi:hypothetical protein
MIFIVAKPNFKIKKGAAVAAPFMTEGADLGV